MCGSDGKTYSNSCTLKKNACLNKIDDLDEVYEGPCRPLPPPRETEDDADDDETDRERKLKVQHMNACTCCRYTRILRAFP